MFNDVDDTVVDEAAEISQVRERERGEGGCETGGGGGDRRRRAVCSLRGLGALRAPPTCPQGAPRGLGAPRGRSVGRKKDARSHARTTHAPGRSLNPALTSIFPFSQEDAWAVISAFFEDKGLVRQQLDSFNEFINASMQVKMEKRS